MRHYKLIRGMTVICAFLCALCIGLGELGKVSDYKAMINGFLSAVSTSAGSADAYAFTSDFEDTVSLLTERKRVAEQIGEEGSVLLKNDGALPLDATAETPKKVTVLGSRAYTYDKNGALRDVNDKDPSKTLGVYGGWVGSPIRAQNVTVKAGDGNETESLPVTLGDALAHENIEINPALVNAYSGKNFPGAVAGSEANGSAGGPFSANEPALTLNECGDHSAYRDACIVMIGRTSGEGREYLPGAPGIADKSDGSESALSLSDNERNLIDVADSIAHGKVVVLINSAVAMEIGDLKDSDKVNAILWIGLPGSYGMNGVARIISGTASPSGKLPDTFAVDASASPAAQNFGVSAMDGSGNFIWNDPRFANEPDRAHYVVLAEGLYTGYRYYETRYADAAEDKGNASAPKGLGYGEPDNSAWRYEYEVAYPFGYGLSYTSFSQEIVENSFTADYEAKTVSLKVRVTNTGSCAGKDVVQLYMQSPYTEYDIAHGVEKAAVELVAFEKTDVLYPAGSEEGESSQEVTLTVQMKYLASYDKTVSHDGVTGGYILEDADYHFALGNGAHEALNNILTLRGIEAEKLCYTAEPDAAAALVWHFGADAPAEQKPSFTDGVNATLLALSEGGETVQNRLSDADYNVLTDSSTVTYLSRSDWQGTFPKAYVNLPVSEGRMVTYLNSRVYQLKSGSTSVEFGVDHSEEEDENGVPNKNLTVADMKLAAYDDERWDYLVEQITFDEAWALAPYGGTYCNMFKSVNAPELWQIDGPNGNVTRALGARAPKSGFLAVAENDPNAGYMSCDMPCGPTAAATFNKELLEEQGRMYGEDMLWSRNPIIWAPGMNLHRTPFNSRNHEYYSEDPMLTNLLGVSFVRGGLSKGAILAAKHFAFNTQESFREGLSQMMEEQSAREMELRAFEGIFEDVNFVNPTSGTEHDALGLMSSFSRVGVCGVNAHTGLMKNILRGEWGFKGMSSTDMVVGGKFFNPQDAVINNVTFMATSNGDNLLSSNWPEYNNKSLVRSDPDLCEALQENMHYYMYALANSNALNGITPDTVISDPLAWWQVTLIAVSAVTGAAAAGLSVWVAVWYIRERRKKSKEAGGTPHGTEDTDAPQGGEET